jgi:hypothetical protein
VKAFVLSADGEDSEDPRPILLHADNVAKAVAVSSIVLTARRALADSSLGRPQANLAKPAAHQIDRRLRFHDQPSICVDQTTIATRQSDIITTLDIIQRSLLLRSA